jgi:hypothetical protein
MMCDCLIVGSGGRGGSGSYAGGGGAGEVIYYPSFNFFQEFIRLKLGLMVLLLLTGIQDYI